MRPQKSHDLYDLREDAIRLVVTAVIVLGAMGLMAFVERRHHVIGRLIAVPTSTPAGVMAPTPSLPSPPP